jgi:molybdopterin synthase catalytic subunit
MTALASPPALGLTHAAIVERALDVSGLVQMVADPGAGAAVVFLGTVRNTDAGRAVVGIDYQAYSPMAARVLHAIVAEAAHQFGTRAIAVEHRSGFLAVGEISVAIVASHERRGPAFDATRYVIEHIKRRVPIWKCEHYADGSRAWVDPTRSASGAGADGIAEEGT